MKAILALVLSATLCLALNGCQSDLPPAKQASQKLKAGITGQGSVYQPDRSNDPIIREQSRVGN
jgi:hypothetical protein